jgi:hypothetical protein
MSAPDTLVVQGSPMSVDTLVPRKGWNLVGCPFQTKTGFAAGLEQRGFSNFVGLGVIKNLDGYWIPNDAKSSIDSFEPGKGVFLFMKN